ncbi:MAG: DNA polymerase III subunit alpha [Pyrinomonadaceae bacterium]
MFSELHTRSAFSFLSSGSQPQRLIDHAAELGIKSVALLDRDTLAGVVRFHFEARECGIKPIIGAEMTMDDGSLLPLIALTRQGYENLARLITTVKLRSNKNEHFTTRQDIEEHSAGLLCFTGGADGFLHNSVKRGDGLKDLAWLNYVFEKRLYIELQRHHLRTEEYINQQLLGLAHKLHLPYFASNGVYYADEQDRELYDVFTCIRNHTTIYDAGKLLSENSERYLKNEAQMRRLFADIPEAIDRTEEIAARVGFSMDELSYTFPDYPVAAGETMDSVLRKKVENAARDRYRYKKKWVRDEVQSRLDKELAIVEIKKLAGYFLVVNDISDYCWQNKILSQGRGSAANSVVCYSLGITAVDPIENNLLFERFLSEKYEQYPDIDIDLPSGDDREKVIQHVYQKYGRRSSGMTANVICYRGKSAVREVGKTFGFGTEVLDRLSRLNSYYETYKGDELERRLKEEGFDAAENHRLKKFAELYHRILDFPRHLGQHSGGMVVSLNRLDSIVPIEPASMDDRTIIQWDKDDCDALKIVKIDLLGLGMMAVLRDSITLIKEHHNRELDLYRIPHDDAAVYDALQNGDTVGMFQVESRAQIAFLPKSKPACFYDIVVQVAIIRPGPIVGNMLHAYIKRRQGIELVTYPHESLKPILERTMGVPLFQEQLLKMAMDIAGFSGGEAEELRRAMGFKHPDKKMTRIADNLRRGMTERNIPPEVQEQIVDYTKAFANYGFPESHAYSFALLAYASAYYIIHYRACFMAAMFNNYPLGFYSAATLVKDAQRHGLHFLPLDINRSDYLFTVEEAEVRTGNSGAPAGASPSRVLGSDRVLQKCVRVGLRFVKGLREDVAKKIVEVRDGYAENHPVSPDKKHQDCHPSFVRRGAFTSIADLIDRVPEINKREIRALSLAGALNFDNTVHRRQALWESELAIQPEGTLFERGAGNGERGTEGLPTASRQLPTAFLSRMEGLQLVEADIRKTGISIGKHPMAFIREEMKRRGVLTAMEGRELNKNDIVSVAGAVIIRQRPMTANNVVFLTVEDETGFANFVVLPDMFERYREAITQNDFLIIRGIFEERGMLRALHFTPIEASDAKVESHDFR